MSNKPGFLHPQTQTNHIQMARGLAALGRAPDSQLIHMSNKEVAGLQHLAMASGGSLTRNPHTGLLEAGWLDSVLPMVAGGLLAATGVGAPAAGLMVGAADTAINHGNWKKGLAAGLGAYGGAGLATGLAGAGASAAGGAGSGTIAGTAAGADIPIVATDTGASIANAGATAAEAAPGITPVATAIPDQGLPAINVGAKAAGQEAVSNGFGTSMSNIGKGISDIGTDPSGVGSSVYANTGKLGLVGLAAPALYNSYSQPTTPSPAKPMPYRSLQYDPSTQSYAYQGQYSYTPYTGFAAGGGVGGAGNFKGTPQNLPPSLTAPVPPPAANAAPPAMPPMPPNNSASAPPNNPIANYYASLTATPSNVMQAPSQAQDQAYQSYMQNLNKQVTGPTQLPWSPGLSASNPAHTSTGIASPTATSSTPTNPSAAAIQAAANDPKGLAAQITNGTYDPNTNTYYPVGSFDGVPKGATQGPSTNYMLPPSPIGWANGGITSLGHYSDGGQFLKGPGDGVSDSIPATIGGTQKAALANNEFVIPARIVSEIGNGSSDAGAKKLYAMMDRIQQRRGKTVGKGKIAVDSGAENELPA